MPTPLDILLCNLSSFRKHYINKKTLSSLLKDCRANCYCASYCARKFECHVMHRARALSTKMNNDRADGHCYGFAWILRFWTFGDPYFSFQKQILFTIISTLSKNRQKNQCGKLRKFKISAHGTWNHAKKLPSRARHLLKVSFNI